MSETIGEAEATEAQEAPQTEAKPPRKPRAPKATQAPAEPAQSSKTAKPQATSKPAPKAAATSGQIATVQGKKAVAMRAKLVDGKPTSWLKIGAALFPDAPTPKAAAGRARAAYRLIKGKDAPTGPNDY